MKSPWKDASRKKEAEPRVVEIWAISAAVSDRQRKKTAVGDESLSLAYRGSRWEETSTGVWRLRDTLKTIRKVILAPKRKERKSCEIYRAWGGERGDVRLRRGNRKAQSRKALGESRENCFDRRNKKNSKKNRSQRACSPHAPNAAARRKKSGLAESKPCHRARRSLEASNGPANKKRAGIERSIES